MGLCYNTTTQRFIWFTLFVLCSVGYYASTLCGYFTFISLFSLQVFTLKQQLIVKIGEDKVKIYLLIYQLLY